jgi:hypothetical protein
MAQYDHRSNAQVNCRVVESDSLVNNQIVIYNGSRKAEQSFELLLHTLYICTLYICINVNLHVEFACVKSVCMLYVTCTARSRFDACFSNDATNADVFDEVSAAITSVLDGYNVSMLAYGQTGSGKTHTMHGTRSAQHLWHRYLHTYATYISCIYTDSTYRIRFVYIVRRRDRGGPRCDLSRCAAAL